MRFPSCDPLEPPTDSSAHKPSIVIVAPDPRPLAPAGLAADLARMLGDNPEWSVSLIALESTTGNARPTAARRLALDACAASNSYGIATYPLAMRKGRLPLHAWQLSRLLSQIRPTVVAAWGRRVTQFCQMALALARLRPVIAGVPLECAEGEYLAAMNQTLDCVMRFRRQLDRVEWLQYQESDCEHPSRKMLDYLYDWCSRTALRPSRSNIGSKNGFDRRSQASSGRAASPAVNGHSTAASNGIFGATSVGRMHTRGKLSAIERTSVRSLVHVPPDAKLITMVAPLFTGSMIKDAIWSADLLRCVYSDIYLGIVGEGPQWDRLRRYASKVRVLGNLRFVPYKPAAEQLVRSSDLFWQIQPVDVVTRGLEIAANASVPIIAADCVLMQQLQRRGWPVTLVPPRARHRFARSTVTVLGCPDPCPYDPLSLPEAIAQLSSTRNGVAAEAQGLRPAKV